MRYSKHSFRTFTWALLGPHLKSRNTKTESFKFNPTGTTSGQCFWHNILVCKTFLFIMFEIDRYLQLMTQGDGLGGYWHWAAIATHLYFLNKVVGVHIGIFKHYETKNMLIVLQLRDQENRAVIIGTYRWS